MTIRPLSTRTRRDDTTAHLTFAMDFLGRTRLDERLAVPAEKAVSDLGAYERKPGDSGPTGVCAPPGPDDTPSGDSADTRRGRPVQYVRYTATAIAAIVYELVASGQPYSIKEIFYAIWYRLTDEQLRLIGLGGIRTPERLADLNPPKKATTEQRDREQKAIDAEYQRLWQAIRQLFGAMDDTPVVANHSKSKRPTVDTVDEAKKNPELIAKTAAKHDIVNAIIAAGLQSDNERRNPGTNLHGPGGILEDHEGHIAVDETHLNVGAWGLPKNVAPGNYLAKSHAGSKIYKGAPALIGLSLGVAVARPSQPHDVPNVCLGAAIHHPTGGLGSAVLQIIDAIETHGLRAPQRSNINQQVIGDGGYTQANGLNQGLTNRRYGIVVKPKKNQRILHEVSDIRHEDGTHTPGIRLFHGAPLCPGASMHALTRTHLTVPDLYDSKRDDGIPNPLSIEELLKREKTLAAILPYRMSTSGRPVEVEIKKRGGQAKSAKPGDRVMRVTLTCPHVKGTARCAIFSDYHDPELAHLPAVPAPPTDLPFEQRPACCENNSGTIQAKIPLQEYKDWQEFMPGTWEHADWYTGPRAANERYNARIKQTSGGSNLNRNTIRPRKAAIFALFTAMAIVNANRDSIESWYATLDDNQRKNDKSMAAIKPSIKPAPKALENKRIRERALKTHRDNSKGPGPNAPRNRSDIGRPGGTTR